MSDYYHNIEDELSMGMVRSDKVLKHVQRQRSRIEELEDLRKKTFSALLTATRLHDEAEAKLAKAVEALVRIADTPSEMTWGVDSEVREAMNKMEIIAETTLAELTSSVAADNQVKGGKHD